MAQVPYPGFKGVITEDVRTSTPDWTPFTQPMPKPGAPNVLLLVWDDTGYGAWEHFGGPIEMPNMKRISDAGLRFTQFHTTALCSPTRAATLTGRNHTTIGMSCIEEATIGYPNGNGHVPPQCAEIPAVLLQHGYNTYMLGKNHMVPEDEFSMASSKRNWPIGRGFERYYGFLGGETNQWYPDLIEDNHNTDQPALPVTVEEWAQGKEGYHLSKDLVDKAIGMIADAKQVAPDRPFFMYFCPGANHAPHHAPKDWIDKYKGKFDMGYEKIRGTILAKQKGMGVIPQNTDLSPLNPMADAKSVDGIPWPANDTVRPWDTLSDDEKRLFCRLMEVYAGYSSYTDHEIGRLLDYLEQSGQMENTLIIAFADNGASGEGGPNGMVNENAFFNNIVPTAADNLPLLDKLGSADTYEHYPNGWAAAMCTPFKMYKRYSWDGGVCDPMWISWPKVIKDKGGIRDQYTHCVDIAATIYECLGIELPEQVNGFTQWPLEGISFKYTFADAKAESWKKVQYYNMLGSRAIYSDGWKADTVHPTVAGWDHFPQDKWCLYHIAEDRSETHDVADQYPEKLEELVRLWYHEAGKYNGLPVDDRTAMEILTTPRPEVSEPRNRYVYFPGTLEVPEAVAVNTRARSFKIAAEVNVTKDASGVIFAHGSMFGGHAIYAKEGKLKYCYNFVGMKEQILSADLPTGKCVVGVEFVKESMEKFRGSPVPNQCVGTCKLYVDDKVVAQQAGWWTQVGKFALCGEGLNIGRDSGGNVTNDFPGEHPWALTGGAIYQVIVDVGDDQYRDLEAEAMGMMSRE
jgi:arylsulfatase A-like enzyme